MATPNKSSRGHHALLLSSDPALRRDLEHALAGRGLDVRSAGDGESGLALLLDELLTLDVLVIDLRLDGHDAWSLLRLIRCAGGERDLPIVVTSCGLDARDTTRLLALGADAVVHPGRGAKIAAEAAVRLARCGRAAGRKPRQVAVRRPQLMLPMLAAA